MKRLVISITAFMVACAIFFAPHTNITPISVAVTASAASANSLTRADIDKYQKAWESHPYCLGVGFAGNKTSTGKQCILGLQKMLNLVMNAGLDEDSGYGRLTQNATKNFQSAYSAYYNLSRDGIVGNATWNALVEAAKKAIDEANASSQATSGALINANSIYIDQYDGYIADRTHKACTLCAVGMVMRAKTVLNGDDPSAITEKRLYNAGWSRYGCISDFSVEGISVTSFNIRKKTGNDYQETIEYLKKLLDEHPEGLAAYSWLPGDSREHCVYLSADYSDGFKILDPAYYGKAEYIKFSESANSISQHVENISQVWIVSTK